MASRDETTGRYQRRQLEQTLLYRIVEEYYTAFAGHLAEQGRELPECVHREFEDYLKYGRLEHGFLRVSDDSITVRVELDALRADSIGRRITPQFGGFAMGRSKRRQSNRATQTTHLWKGFSAC